MSSALKAELTNHYINLLAVEDALEDLDLSQALMPKTPYFHGEPAGPEKHLWTDGSFSDREGVAGWSFVDPITAINLCGNIPASKLVDGELNCGLTECVGVMEALRYHPDRIIFLHVDRQSTIDVGAKLDTLAENDFRDLH